MNVDDFHNEIAISELFTKKKSDDKPIIYSTNSKKMIVESNILLTKHWIKTNEYDVKLSNGGKERSQKSTGDYNLYIHYPAFNIIHLLGGKAKPRFDSKNINNIKDALLPIKSLGVRVKNFQTIDSNTNKVLCTIDSAIIDIHNVSDANFYSIKFLIDQKNINLAEDLENDSVYIFASLIPKELQEVLKTPVKNIKYLQSTGTVSLDKSSSISDKRFNFNIVSDGYKTSTELYNSQGAGSCYVEVSPGKVKIKSSLVDKSSFTSKITEYINKELIKVAGLKSIDKEITNKIIATGVIPTFHKMGEINTKLNLDYFYSKDKQVTLFSDIEVINDSGRGVKFDIALDSKGDDPKKDLRINFNTTILKYKETYDVLAEYGFNIYKLVQDMDSTMGKKQKPVNIAALKNTINFMLLAVADYSPQNDNDHLKLNIQLDTAKDSLKQIKVGKLTTDTVAAVKTLFGGDSKKP